MMDISDLLSNISAEDLQKLKETANQIMGTASPAAAAAQEKNEREQALQAFSDPEIITKILKFSKTFSKNDDRTNFLLALKPMLSTKRREKTDTVIFIHRMMGIMSEIGKNDQPSEKIDRFEKGSEQK